MTVSKAQQASANKYVKNNYDRINVTFPKGEREIIKSHASAKGESMSGFIVRVVKEAIERDNAVQATQRVEDGCSWTTPRLVFVKLAGSTIALRSDAL